MILFTDGSLGFTLHQTLQQTLHWDLKKTIMNYKEIVKKICVALNIEVKLEQMKLNDGVTVIEADSFEANNEVFIITLVLQFTFLFLPPPM